MSVPARALGNGEKHYLAAELHDLVGSRAIWQFIRGVGLDGIWYWDLENPENEWMSPEFWRLFGIDPSMKGHEASAWENMIHPDDLALAKRNFQLHCSDPDHPYDQIIRCRHADGSTVWVRRRGLALRRPDGTPYRMIGSHYNVTAFKLAEEKARRDRVAARETNEDLKAFAFLASHDLKSPVNTVQMLLDEMRVALLDQDYEDTEHLLSHAHSTTKQMRSLIDGLLKYTRVVDPVVDMEIVDLDRILNSVQSNLASDIHATGAIVDVSPLGSVIGSAWQLTQLFQNLIANAIKFQPEGQTPTVKIRAAHGALGRRRIEVIDNGIGISTEDQARIFGLFSQLHRASSFKGIGLGLAFCHRVAVAHGTEIKVRSSEGRGTTFSLQLKTSGQKR